MVELFTCPCGLSFKTREEIRKHTKKCTHTETSSFFTCSVCSDSTRILLPYGEVSVCPSCAVSFEKPTIAFGSLMINHMARKYDMIFRQKVGTLLKCINVKKLSDMGIVVILITFSQEGFVPFAYSHNPKGELIFIFSKKEHIQEREEKSFEYVINHEVFHAYVYKKLKLGITDVLKKPLTFLEYFAGTLAEDVQLIKIAVSKNVKPLLLDETRRTNVYFKKLPTMSTSQWNMLPDEMKFNSMASLTLTYTTELWFNEILRASHAKKRVRKNIRLVQPHYAKLGYPNLTKLIQELYTEKIAETKREKQTMCQKILMCCDKWVEDKGFDLY